MSQNNSNSNNSNGHKSNGKKSIIPPATSVSGCGAEDLLSSAPASAKNGLPNAQARRDLFVAEYILSKNATKAAQKAGYSVHSAYSQGQRLLKNAEIQARIAKAQEDRIQRLELTADYVLQGIKDTVERCRQIVPVLDRKGEQVYCETEDGEEVPAFTFNALGALKGYELLGKHLKLFTERVENIPPDNEAAIAEKAMELYLKAFPGTSKDEAQKQIELASQRVM